MKKEKYWILDNSFLLWSGTFGMVVTCKTCRGPGCPECNGKGKVQFTNSKGNVTGGLYLIIEKMLARLEEGYKIIFAFDPPRESLERFKLLDTYKASRTEKPDSIIYQGRVSKDLFPMFGNAESYISDFSESDDIMATLALQYSHEGHEVVVETRDKDLYPVLDLKNVRIYRDGGFLTRDDFIKKYEFTPSRFNEYLALAGDAADNFNIFPGVGDKAVRDIISRTQHITQIWDKKIWDDLPKKYKKYLAEHDENGKFIQHRKDDLKLSLKIATLDFNANCIPMTKDKNSEFNIKRMLEELEFYNALKKINILVGNND